ncbi:hypothetical protein Tco_0554508 [Tanacetum coccineum]
MGQFLRTTMVERDHLHHLTCVFWTSSVCSDRFLSSTALRSECTSCGLRGQRYSILLQFLADVCWRILVNIIALTGLLRRVGLSLSCLSLENTLAVCEGRVPLDAVTGICLLFLGLFFLSHDSDSENCDLIVMLFTNFSELIRGETPRITVGCLLTPFAGRVSDCGIGTLTFFPEVTCSVLTLFGLVTGDCLSCSGARSTRMCVGYDPCGAAEFMLLADMYFGMDLLKTYKTRAHLDEERKKTSLTPSLH